MQQYFNIYLEFDQHALISAINKAANNGSTGYVCVVDGNVLAHACKYLNYKDIINGSIINSCDGSSIAILAGYLHKQKFSTYTGPEIFAEYIKQKKFRQYFLGNTLEIHESLKAKFRELEYNMDQFRFQALPFLNVNDFNYPYIANNINDFSPDIIWVSLGAPKQEYFISKLFPFIDKGILIAIGAAFNLFLGNEKFSRAPIWMRKIHLEWIYRIIKEPTRVGKRALNYALVIPKLVIEERKKIRKSLQNEAVS